MAMKNDLMILLILVLMLMQSLEENQFHHVDGISTKDIHSSKLTELLRRKVCIPVLAGKHIPSHPGPPPATVSDDSKAHEWKRRADEYGAYFVSLLAEWSLMTKVPLYELSWIGFAQMVFNLTKAAGTGDIVSSSRLQYIRNCGDASSSDASNRLTTTLWRMMNATTFNDYQIQK